MSHQWVVQLRPTEAASLGRLRRRPGLEVCEHPDALWLRIRDPEEGWEAEIRALPGRRFGVLSDRQLVPLGRRVPMGSLPEGPWIPLSEWMPLQVQPAAFSGKVTDKVPLRIVRGGQPAEANVLLTTAEVWQEYAIRAPQVRLDRWAFAMSDDGQVVIRGEPLPPLRGTRFVEKSGVAAPVGWTWTPAMNPEIVRAALGLQKEDLALVRLDGRWDHIGADDFVRATRSAVRVSTEAMKP